MAIPETPLQWDVSVSNDLNLKYQFIRSVFTESEIKDILHKMLCDHIPHDYEECVQRLVETEWKPTKEQLRRHDLLRATPIEHDDDEQSVHFESGDLKYLSSRTNDQLEQWLNQHNIQHDAESKKQLVELVHNVFGVTSPIRTMSRSRLCPKTNGKQREKRAMCKTPHRLRMNSGMKQMRKTHPLQQRLF